MTVVTELPRHIIQYINLNGTAEIIYKITVTDQISNKTAEQTLQVTVNLNWIL
jgi:Tfp pilus assembly protein PilX